jgi:hypothetical protein
MRRHWAALALFTAVVTAVYVASPVVQSGDGRLVVYEAKSILHEGNLDLHEYGAAVHGFPCYREGGRILSRYPYGTSFVTVPILAVVAAGGKLLGSNPTSRIRDEPPRVLEKNLAAIIAALTAAAIALLGVVVSGRLATGLLLGALFAFGSSLWSTVSRGLWQHGPAMLLMTIALISLVLGIRREDRRWIAGAGAAMAAAYVVRPTAVIPLGLAGIALLVTRPRAALAYGVGALVVLVPSVIYNLYVYDSPVIPFYFEGSGFLGEGLRSTFLTGLWGTVGSPSRGLLVFSPFLLLAAVGVAIRRRPGLVELVAIGTTLLIWLVTANTIDWPGGWSYGPRLLADTSPFLALLMIPALDRIARPPRNWSTATTVTALALVLTAGWSVFVHARGATSWATQMWNPLPVPAGVDTNPQRFSDWSDPQFLRTGDASFEDVYPHSTPPDVDPALACIE